MTRLYSEDAYNLGLLYVYIYSNGIQKMVSLQDLDAFYKQIENNLEIMNSENYGIVYDNNDEKIYFTSSNEIGEIYYILKPTFDLEKAKSTYIGCVSTKYLVASQMNNALSCIGLIKVNGNIISKRKYFNELAEKYGIKYELPITKPKFNIFESWEKIAENGFIENYSLSKEEKLILEELRKNKQAQGQVLRKEKK